MKYNYVLIEENLEYLSCFFNGFLNHVERQFLQMKKVSVVTDIRDLDIRNFYNGKPYCFIIGGQIYEYYGNFLISYLKTYYSGCKIVLELIDLADKYAFEVGNFKDWFDMVVVFEAKDAKKYNLKYLPMTFDYLPVRPYEIESDFFFVGGGNLQKKRLRKIMELYDILTKKGYQCDFWLSDIPRELQYNLAGVHYGYLPFEETLSHIKSTKCIVEIVQNGMSSSTIRYVESVLYGKHLLTNAETTKEDDVYGEYRKHVHIISNNMDFDFLNEKISYDPFSARIFFSNDTFISAIEQAIL